MDEKNSSVLIEKENYVKKLKRGFDSWREIVLHVNSVLLWKNNAYFWILLAIPTNLFLILMYYDPSFLTTVSLFCILITLLDYVGPMISSAVWKQDSWTAVKEKELEDICKALAGAIIAVKFYLVYIKEMKTTWPNMYYPSAIACLTLFAWIGNSVDNRIITYLLVLTVLMLPGLIHYGILQKYYKMIMIHVTKTLNSFSTVALKKNQ